MQTRHPLQPVWGGLASFIPGVGSVEPPEATEEEKEIQMLREPLSQWLRDAERFVNDRGMAAELQRFRDNGLVRVALHGGYPRRRGYAKQDCIADLHSLIALLKGMREEEHRKERSALAEQLHAAREAAGQSQETAAAEIGIDSKAYAQYERGERQPRRNRLDVMAYIGRHLAKH
jgi:DNA-binding XRE family transcriptional regulator